MASCLQLTMACNTVVVDSKFWIDAMSVINVQLIEYNVMSIQKL